MTGSTSLTTPQELKNRKQSMLSHSSSNEGEADQEMPNTIHQKTFSRGFCPSPHLHPNWIQAIIQAILLNKTLNSSLGLVNQRGPKIMKQEVKGRQAINKIVNPVSRFYWVHMG